MNQYESMSLPCLGCEGQLGSYLRASFPESRSWRWKLWSPNDSVWYERIRELWEDCRFGYSVTVTAQLTAGILSDFRLFAAWIQSF